MPNLVGIGNSQVPTNAMLGGLAYQDPEHTTLINADIENIAAIKAKINETAVDIFVYNTSLDSDGGAWRKRCQHTSWYNELLGTEKRGTRREFPAIAVLVTTTTRLNIYDGDDPNMSLWRSIWFNNNGTSAYQVPKVSAVNAIICLAFDGVWPGLGVIDLIADWAELRDERNNNGTNRRVYNPIASEAVDKTSNLTSKNGLTGDQVNDIAMTVLPGAPIDEVTGLPVPTIAAACDTGVAIRTFSPGREYDCWLVSNSKTLTGGIENHRIDFLSDGKIVVEQGWQYVTVHRDYRQESQGYSSSMSNSDHYFDENGVQFGGWAELETPRVGTSDVEPWWTPVAIGDGNFVTGHAGDALNHYDDNASLIMYETRKHGQNSAKNGMLNAVSLDYTSGWQVGDIDRAWLCTTDSTTTRTGSDKLGGTGVFSNQTMVNAWSNASNGTKSLDSGQLRVTSGAGGYASVYKAITVVVGRRYTLEAYVHASTALNGACMVISTSNAVNSGGAYGSSETVPTGNWKSVHLTFTATATTMYVHCQSQAYNANEYSVFDVVTCRESEADVSHSKKAISVYGTVPVEPVATGAELCCYGPFSTSNYLKQQFDEDFEYGTGNFCVMFWFKSTGSGSEHFIRKGIPTGSQGIFEAYMTSVGGAGNIRFAIKDDDGTSSTVCNAARQGWNDGDWHHFIGFRKNKHLYLYLDGKFNNFAESNASYTVSWASMSSYLEVGCVNGSANAATTTRLALMRIGQGVPNENQIQKIYYDEKKLFAPNAKCTIYGSSSAVKAMAYDKVTDTLHVGTSQGRSDFNGLVRINNTTTAVTTAISASGGVIAEQ